MICPSCEIEMVPVGGRLTCLECGYNEPLRKVSMPLFDEDEGGEVRSFQKKVEQVLEQYEDPRVHFRA